MLEISFAPNYLEGVSPDKCIFWKEAFIRKLFSRADEAKLLAVLPKETDNLLIAAITSKQPYTIKAYPRINKGEYYQYITGAPIDLELTVNFSVTHASSFIAQYNSNQSELNLVHKNYLNSELIFLTRVPPKRQPGQFSPFTKTTLILRHLSKSPCLFDQEGQSEKTTEENTGNNSSVDNFLNDMQQAALALCNDSVETPTVQEKGGRTLSQKSRQPLTTEEYFELYVREEEHKDKKGKLCRPCFIV